LFAKVLEDYYILIYSHWQELVKSMGSTGSYSLPNMMKAMTLKEVRSRSHLAMFHEAPAQILMKEGGINTHLIMIGVLHLMGVIGVEEAEEDIQTDLFRPQGLQE